MIPAFYLKPISLLPAALVSGVQKYFHIINGVLSLETAGEMCLLLELPFYLRTALFHAFNKKLGDSFTCAEFLAKYQANAPFLVGPSQEEVVFNLLTRFRADKQILPRHLEGIVNDVIQSE